MKQQTSLGDFISALYDTLGAGGAAQEDHSTSEVVGACAFTVLRRQRNRQLLRELFQPADAPAG